MKKNEAVATRFAVTSAVLAFGLFAYPLFALLGKDLSRLQMLLFPLGVLFAFLAKFKSCSLSKARRIAAWAMVANLVQSGWFLFFLLGTLFYASMGHDASWITAAVDSLVVTVYFGVSYVRGRFF